ncbi:reverse transcriptase [Gossypium australe]|uniref:Reverse transcriptase n=1 Tax=Gossypium australe TaxID=47621 RepID=A0A5B6X5A7_9ROSI|nr:reverse transcriptase [Gossypium australe]
MKSKHNSKRSMAIRIDLEKAYDRVRWDFIKASIQKIGYYDSYHEYIYADLVEWSLDSKVQPSKGTEPALSHLFFANDLVIFGKADMKHVILIKKILENFCGFFGYWINVNKSTIYFLKGVDEDYERRLCETLKF